MRWKRRPTLPPEARAALTLERRERVLAAGRLADGSWAAATRGALVLPALRLDWISITHAGWDRETATLAIDQLPSMAGREPQSHRLVLDEPGFLPEVVRERVTASIVASRHIPVAGRAGVRVVARRVTGQDDLVWQVVVDPGLDPADPLVQAAGESGVADLHRELGG